MAGKGLVDLFFKDLRWTLESEDDFFSLSGQFTTTDLQEQVSANYSEFRSLGRSKPIQMFMNENLNEMTFTARFHARHNGLFGLFSDRVDDQAEDVRGLSQVVEKLGRPRIFTFSVGESISMRCVCISSGGIAYERLRPATGDLRGFTAQITLREYVEFDTSLSGRPAESLVQPFLGGDSYETIANRFYGDANLGEALRRRNPEIPTPKTGTFLHIPPKEIIGRGFALTPQSPALKKSPANDARRIALFKERSQKKTRVFTLGPEWNNA